MSSKEVAGFISHTFNAPVVAALTFLTLLTSERAPNFLILTMIFLTFGTAVPLILLYCLSRKGIIPDLYASKGESRAIPFVGAMLSYLPLTSRSTFDRHSSNVVLSWKFFDYDAHNSQVED